MSKEKQFNSYLSKRIVELVDTSCEIILIEVKNKFNEMFPIKETKSKLPKINFWTNLKDLCSVVEPNCVLPSIENAFLAKDGILTSTNLNLYYQLQTNIIGKEAIIPISILKNVKNEENILDVLFDNDNCKGILITDQREMIFTSCPISDFPIAPHEYHSKHQFDLTTEDYLNTKKLFHFTAKEELRPVMNGILFGEELVATDANRLMWFKTTSDMHNSSFVIDRKHIPHLFPGLMNTLYSMSNAVAIDSNNWVTLEDNGRKLWIRLTDGKYPNYRAVIPKIYDCPITVSMNKKKLISAIQDLLPFCNQTTNKVDFTIRHDSSDVIIYACDLDYGKELTMKVKKESSLGDIIIACNGKLMLSILKQIDDDIITFSMSSPSRCILINENSLVMPVMLE
jgi:DNA polymerase III sliding clamp (beta) subunit (PCNA family)